MLRSLQEVAGDLTSAASRKPMEHECPSRLGLLCFLSLPHHQVNGSFPSAPAPPALLPGACGAQQQAQVGQLRNEADTQARCVGWLGLGFSMHGSEAVTSMHDKKTESGSLVPGGLEHEKQLKESAVFPENPTHPVSLRLCPKLREMSLLLWETRASQNVRLCFRPRPKGTFPLSCVPCSRHPRLTSVFIVPNRNQLARQPQLPVSLGPRLRTPSYSPM